MAHSAFGPAQDFQERRVASDGLVQSVGQSRFMYFELPQMVTAFSSQASPHFTFLVEQNSRSNAILAIPRGRQLQRL